MLVGISLITYDVEILFTCSFASCISSLVRYLLRALVHFLIRLSVFLLLSFRCYLYIWDMQYFIGCTLCKFFSKLVLSLLILSRDHLFKLCYYFKSQEYYYFLKSVDFSRTSIIVVHFCFISYLFILCFQ